MSGQDRQRFVDQLIEDEGLRLTVYRDSLGIETIGVGRNIRDKGISHAEAMLLLDHDIDEVVTDLAESFPWFVTLDPVRQRVVANMRFQFGAHGFRKFKQMLAAMTAGDYVKAGEQMATSLWATQVPMRATRLITRMVTGIEP